MVKKKLLQRLFSTLLTLLFHGRPWLSSLATAAAAAFTPHPSSPPPQQQQKRHRVCGSSLPPMAEKLAAGQTLVLDVDGGLLLRSASSPAPLFPYFMLVALEAGSFLRGLLLLLLYPLLRCCSMGGGGGSDAAVRVMAMAAFCGLRASGFRAGRAVLPKWFMEDVAAEGLEAMRSGAGGKKRVVCVTRMPRVMVEGFLREYLEAEVVVGREMKVLWGFYTGLMEEEEDDPVVLEEKKKIMHGGDGDAVGFSGSLEFLQHPLSRYCKEIYHVTREDRSTWRALPRDRYPKPMVFHDGRLAFRPTAAATLAMFVWLPFGVALGAARLAVALAVPYRYSTPVLAATGMSWRLEGERPPLPGDGRGRGRGQLFVCNHRTLIDPVYVSVALDRQVRAVSYSLSRLSELISPIGRTVRLTRDRDGDGRVMARLLDRGDLVVVCPEGTTCREPYLLRFSPLFAELSDDVVPVGISVETAMFYATTAGGLKCLDPLYYMINPRMCYTVQFLERVRTAAAAKVPSTDVANLVQRKIGDALGYGCTMLTRKDKYLMLAGNDGVVDKAADGKCSSALAGRKKK